MTDRDVHELIDTIFSSEIDAAKLPTSTMAEIQEVLDSIKEDVHALVRNIIKNTDGTNVDNS